MGIYEDALKANPEWLGLYPSVLIVYGGPKRYSLANPGNVELVYVGRCPPSRVHSLDLGAPRALP